MRVVAFVGFAGCGKNTAASALVDEGWIQVSFADALKDAVAVIFGWPRHLLEGDTDESRAWREQRDVWWSLKLDMPHFTPRWALQNFSTDVMRKHFHPDIWLLRFEKTISELPENANVAITDMRFRNEERLVDEVYRIKRGPDPEWIGTALMAAQGREKSRQIMQDIGVHESEYAWAGIYLRGVIVNDGSVSGLHDSVRKTVLGA